MARGQVSWAGLELDGTLATARAQVSWAQFSITSGFTNVSDSGVGVDAGTRTSSGQVISVSDAGVGTDTGTGTVGGAPTLVFGTERGFGFSRYSSAGFMHLFRQEKLESELNATAAAKIGLDSAEGIDISVVQFQDRALSLTETGVAVDSSTFGSRVLSRTDTGHGTDSSGFDPGPESPLPEVTLEVAFDSDPTDEAQVYTVVSSESAGRQLEFSAKRGRQDELQGMQTGTLVTALFNQDRALDPAYSLSPYFPQVLPVKQVRLKAAKGSTVYPLFVGDIEQWPQQQQSRLNKAVIQANDGFDALNQVQVTIERPFEYSGQRIAAILDAAAWPSSQRDLDTGQTLLHANTYTGTALELIRNVVADEDGYFFISGNGAARFIERHARFKPPYTTPYLTLSNRPTGAELPLSDADYQVDKDFIKNEVVVKIQTVADSEGAPLVEELEFSVRDEDSQRQYRPRTLTYDNSSIAVENEAQTKVEYHLDRLKDPIVRVKSVTIEPQMNNALWEHALGREVGDRIAVEIFPVQTGTEEVVYFEGIIEYVEHRYVVGRWTTIWYLSPADVNDYWILGDTELGELDVTTKLGF